MHEQVLLALAGGVASGGLIGAGATAYTAKKKVPAEVDSIIVTGAETAVQSLQASLAAETARAERAEAQVRERDARIDALEAKIDVLYTALDAVRDELIALKSSTH